MYCKFRFTANSFAPHLFSNMSHISYATGVWSSVFSLNLMDAWYISVNSEDFWHKWTRDKITDIGGLFLCDYFVLFSLFFFIFFPLCCYSLTEFHKSLLECSLQGFPLSTYKPGGNSCHVLHMAIISVVCEKNPQHPSQKNKRNNSPLMRCFLSTRVKLEKNIPVDGRCSCSIPQSFRSSLRRWSIRETRENNLFASLKPTKHWHKLQYCWKSFRTSHEDDSQNMIQNQERSPGSDLKDKYTRQTPYKEKRWQRREVFRKGLFVLSSSTCKGVISGC